MAHPAFPGDLAAAGNLRPEGPKPCVLDCHIRPSNMHWVADRQRSHQDGARKLLPTLCNHLRAMCIQSMRCALREEVPLRRHRGGPGDQRRTQAAFAD